MNQPIETAEARPANETAMLYAYMSPLESARAIVRLQRQLQAMEVRLAELEAAKK